MSGQTWTAGKIAIVTGAGHGLGRAIAQGFARLGATVVVVTRPEHAKLGNETAAIIQKAGGQASASTLEVTQEAAWTAFAADVKARYGGFHFLVNADGEAAYGLIKDMDMAVYDRCMELMVAGPWVGMKVCAPLMRESGGGAIVNVAPAMGARVLPGWGVVASLGEGLRSITAAFAASYAMEPSGVRANTVSVGPIWPEGLSHAKDWPAELVSGADETQAAVEAVLFLACPDSGYMNGAHVFTDAGRSLR